MFDKLTVGIEILFLLLQGYYLKYFLDHFLERRFERRKWTEWMQVLCFAGLKWGINGLLPSEHDNIRIIGKPILTLISIFVLTFFFYKARHRITVFLVVTYMAITEIGIFLAYTILYVGQGINEFWIWCLEQGYISSTELFMQRIELTLTILFFLQQTGGVILLFLSLKRIIKSFHEKSYPIHRTELFFILTPGLTGLLMCTLLRRIMITVDNGVPMLLYDEYPVLSVLVPAIMFLCLLSIFYGIKLFQDMIHLNLEKANRIILENQIENMQEQMKEMEHLYSGVRSMKHDMKNTFSVILQLSAENGQAKNDRLQDYLSELNGAMEKLEIQFRTGNVIVDTLLNVKQHELNHLIPNLEIDAQNLVIPQNSNISDYDLGIVIGNALDNAIEACEKWKAENEDAKLFVKLSSFLKGKFLFLEIENSFRGKLDQKPNLEFPITNKANKEFHGIGLQSIKKTAEKYSGGVEWAAEHNVFWLSVMMKIK